MEDRVSRLHANEELIFFANGDGIWQRSLEACGRYHYVRSFA